MTLRSRLLATLAVASFGLVGTSILVQVGTWRVDRQRELASAAEQILRAFLTLELDTAQYLREANEVIVFKSMVQEDSSVASVRQARERVALDLHELNLAMEGANEGRDDDRQRAEERRETQLLRDGFGHLAGEIDDLLLEPEGRVRLVEFHDAFDIYERGFASAIDAAVAGERRAVDAANAELARVAGQTRVRTFLLSGAIAAAVLLLLFMTSRRVVAGVTSLKEATRRIATGDLSSAARGHGMQDEFGEVATAFADMAEALRQRTAEVTASHEELEVANRQLAESLRAVQETQAQLVQSAKLAAVGQLAGGLAHEINNPLGVILGFAQGVQRRLKSDDALHLPIDSIVREGLRCKSLVQELLTFSRTAKKGNEPCDLNQVVLSALALVETKARTVGVEVVKELELDLPSIDGNPTQLQQVIVNLGTNALDAMEGGGVLTVRTSRDDGGALAVEVVDTGSGIPPDVLAHIFEPFFTTKEVGKGTGLGLSLVHEMVRQHGGDIAVDSHVGRGTRMRVRLPIAPAHLQAPAAVA